MSLRDYIHNLQQKPVRERERIAVIATAIGFAVIFLIWIVSFKEMNKPAEVQADPASASFNDLKNNFQDGKDSIQDMMQELPSQTGATGMDNSEGIAPPDPDANLQNTGENMDTNNQNNQDKPSVPQLP